MGKYGSIRTATGPRLLVASESGDRGIDGNRPIPLQHGLGTDVYTYLPERISNP